VTAAPSSRGGADAVACSLHVRSALADCCVRGSGELAHDWAVGYGNGQSPVMLRWDGTGWTRTNVAATGDNGILTAIARVGRTLWVTGFSDTEQGGTLVLRKQ
jgi:hypothetical protein